MNNSILTRNEVLAIAAHMAERTTRNNSPVFAGMRLSGVDLSYITLEGIDFKGVNLKGANFTEAKLENVNFEGANLKGANFTCVKMKSVNFEGANLEGVILQYAELEYVNLKGVNLKYANCLGAWFRGVYLIGANLKGVNFEATKGFCALQVSRLHTLYAVGGHNGVTNGVRFYIWDMSFDAPELQRFIRNDYSIHESTKKLYFMMVEVCLLALGK